MAEQRRSEPSAATDGSLRCGVIPIFKCGINLWQPFGFPHFYYIRKI